VGIIGSLLYSIRSPLRGLLMRLEVKTLLVRRSSDEASSSRTRAADRKLEGVTWLSK